MKLAFTSEGTTWNAKVDPRFGRSRYFVFYNEENEELTSYDNYENFNEAHGAGPNAAKIIFDEGAKVLITGNGPGGNAATILEKTGISVHIGAGNISLEEAYKKI